MNIKKIKEPFSPKGKRFFYFLQFGIYSFIMGVAGERSSVVSEKYLSTLSSAFGRSAGNILNNGDCVLTVFQLRLLYVL